MCNVLCALTVGLGRTGVRHHETQEAKMGSEFTLTDRCYTYPCWSHRIDFSQSVWMHHHKLYSTMVLVCISGEGQYKQFVDSWRQKVGADSELPWRHDNPAALVRRGEDNEWTVVSKRWSPEQVIQMSATSTVNVKATQELHVSLLQLWPSSFMVLLKTLLAEVSLLACTKSFASSRWLREMLETRTNSYMLRYLPERNVC